MSSELCVCREGEREMRNVEYRRRRVSVDGLGFVCQCAMDSPLLVLPPPPGYPEVLAIVKRNEKKNEAAPSPVPVGENGMQQ